jgi:hypothetical protein
MDGEPLTSVFMSDVENVLAKYSGQGLTLCEVIGALEIIKLNAHAASRDAHVADQEQEEEP